MTDEILSNNEETGLISLLKQVKALKDLSEDELRILIPVLKKISCKADEIIIQEGKVTTSAYIVADGEFSFEKMGRKVKTIYKGDFFGEIAFFDSRSRTGTVRANTSSTLFSMSQEDLENESVISPKITLKIYKGFSRQITSFMREGTALFNNMDVLLIQDGGCAPGYNSVTAFISEYLEKSGRIVFIASEGFRSVVSNRTEDYNCLIYDRNFFNQIDHIAGVYFSPVLRESSGANFRSERYPEFIDPAIQKTAARNIISRKVKVIVGIGGNGTFAGIKALSTLLPENVQVFFIPVTIDSDISGTECIGEFTGIEFGAEKIRCYMADARTHNRCYIIEMMGAQGGFHALHSCLGAGAHLAVLPSSEFDINEVVELVGPRNNTVIAVAEGYKNKERKKEKYTGNAADYFRDELLAAGLQTKQKIVCEGFSRDIRGANPNNMDLMLAQQMSRKLCKMVLNNETLAMPAVRSGKEYSISFDDIRTDNSVESSLASLANRLAKYDPCRE